MIHKLGQVMLYVNDQDKSREFWTELMEFHIVNEEDNGPMRWIEIAPTEQAETSIILHNKDVVAKMSPGLNLGTPSLMFFTDSFDELHTRLTSKSITVGEIVTLPSGRVFNFADYEENYFAVMERK